jgi:hypothetical protein
VPNEEGEEKIFIYKTLVCEEIEISVEYCTSVDTIRKDLGPKQTLTRI